MDELGRVFVHGTVSNDASGSQSTHDYDMVVLAYDTDGETRWEASYTGDGMGDGSFSWDRAGGIAIDPHGFVVLAGYTMTEATDYDVIVRVVAP